MTDEPKPCDRFEWERIIRRYPMYPTTKLVALILATYADSDGTRVWPGVDRLGYVTGSHKATVIRHLNALRAYGLITRVRQGDRARGNADEYRLTVPTDLAERELLPPEEQPP